MKERAAFQAASAGQQTVETGGAASSYVEADKPRSKKTPAAGLAFPRFFTEPGVDPFDEIEWELRAAVIGNERGEVVFEQRDVEIPNRGRSRPPTSWSRSISAARWHARARAQRQAADRPRRRPRSRTGRARKSTSRATRTCRRSATI
jgi:hypothetical protein